MAKRAEGRIGEALPRRSVRILVVDDEPGSRYIVRRMLEVNGYRVQEAVDGMQALEMVRADPDRLDLILSDLSMPRLNGVQLLETLATEVPELPFVLMSGYPARELATLGIEAPCGTLPKPLVEEVLIKEVARCLRQRN